MNDSQRDSQAIVLAVRASIERALADQSEAPLLKAAELLAEALAQDPSLAAVLDASALEELMNALGLSSAAIGRPTKLSDSPVSAK